MRSEPTLLELTAGSVNVATTGIADGGLDSMHRKSLLQGLYLFKRRGAEGAVRDVVELDQINVAKRSGAEIDKCLHLRVGIVDAINHGELVCWSTSGLFNIKLNGLVKAGECVFLHAGHELIARGLHRGMK